MGFQLQERAELTVPLTFRCEGRPFFRSQMARDLGCLLDFDETVDSWRCLSNPVLGNQAANLPDFLVRKGENLLLVDATRAECRDRLAMEPWMQNLRHECWPPSEIASAFRLPNVRDLLRLAGRTCPLGDRIRLLSALDDALTLTLAEASGVFRETMPMPGIASLVVHRFVSMELDEAPIGPETRIRRWSR